MPRNGSLIAQDLSQRGIARIGVSCPKCGRHGSYSVSRLIEERGPDAMLTYWLSEITADCPKRVRNAIMDQCGAVMDLGEFKASAG